MNKDFAYLVNNIAVDKIIEPLMVLIMALALVYFLLGVFKYVKAADEAKLKEAGKMIVTGLIGLFAMGSVWGLVNVLQKTFNLDNTPPGTSAPSTWWDNGLYGEGD
ncbi:MAG: hypothetical protein AAB468_03265 [Patescibacteria group bacterium]